jgi:hypothetical protein
VREQFFMLIIDQEASLAAIPRMLPHDMELRRAAVAAIREVLSVAGEISGESAARLKRIAELFGVSEGDPQASGSSFSPRAKAS